MSHCVLLWGLKAQTKKCLHRRHQEFNFSVQKFLIISFVKKSLLENFHLPDYYKKKTFAIKNFRKNTCNYYIKKPICKESKKFDLHS